MLKLFRDRMNDKLVIVQNYEEMSERGAEFILSTLRSNSSTNLALATGSTPKLSYQILARDFRSLNYKGYVFNLDEYVGFSEENPVSNRFYLQQDFLKPTGISREQIHLIDGVHENPQEYCRSYEELIKRFGGIGLAILGIGPDGHVANVMPSSNEAVLRTRTSVVELPPHYLEYHAEDFAKLKEPPRYSITMGMGTIFDSKVVLMMASGNKKAQAVKDTLEGSISPLMPGSVLQSHPNCTWIVDKGASSLLGE